MSPSATTPPPNASPSPLPPSDVEKVNLVRLAHVYYTHVNFDREQQFLTDFGFTQVSRLNAGQADETVYYRGYGTEPFVYCATKGEKEDAFGGAAFVVESRKDLELAARSIPSAGPIWEMRDAPGGGECVTVRDPVDGFKVHLVHGQAQREIDELYRQREFNFVGRFFFSLLPGCQVSIERQERAATDHGSSPLRSQQRNIAPPTNSNDSKKVSPPPSTQSPPTLTLPPPPTGPAQVHKLGHFGLAVTSFPTTLSFWSTHFNLKPSDLLSSPATNTDIMAFMHLDRGLELVDHHCFFFFQGPRSHVHHSSFEVWDFDTQVLGHEWLGRKGYENCWGVGRHVLGSQIFDYWWVFLLGGVGR